MKKIFQLILLVLLTSPLFAQMSDAPDRTDGEGPFDRLIIRGVNMIDGTPTLAIRIFHKQLVQQMGKIL